MYNDRKKIFIQSVFPAPYRVGVFKEMSKYCDIFVAFERNNDNKRNADWFIKEFGFDGIILDNEVSLSRYKKEIKNLKIYDCVLAYDYASISSIKLIIHCLTHHMPYFINCDGALIKRHIVKDLIKNFLIKRAKACFANGEHAEKYFLIHGAKKENVYRHNFSSLYKEDILKEPISYEEKNKIREELKLPVERKIVLGAGQFLFMKGYDILLKSWKLVGEGALLIIVGGGEKEKEYRNFIEEGHIENVLIEGFHSRDVIFKYCKAADLFVHPTRGDIWGLVINEAMACGLPVITTDKCIAGIELINNYENGFIVPVEDINLLADKIKLFLCNDNLTLKARCNNLDKIKEYTIENVAKTHIQVMEKVML